MNTLGKRFAGLPVWAWAAILGGGLVIGLVLRSRSSSSDEDTSVTEDTGASDYYDSSYDPTDAGYYMSDPGFTLGSTPTYPGAYNNDPDAIAAAIISAWDAWADDNDFLPNGNGGNGGKKCKDGKPNKKPPKGFKYQCLDGHWVLVGKPGEGTKHPPREDDEHRPGGGKGGGKHDGKGDTRHGGNHGGRGDGRNRSVPLTGGGAPVRRNSHLPFREGMTSGGVGRGGRGPGSR